MPIVRKYGFKQRGGECFKEAFRKLLSLEWNHFEKYLNKNSVCQNTQQISTAPKINRLFRRNNRLFIPVHKYKKTEFKEIKDRENAHRGLYWFTLNPKLHPVFPETTWKSTKQSTLDHLQHNQRSDLDPFKTHTSFGSAQHH